MHSFVILTAIFEQFAAWSNRHPGNNWACTRGCCSCCSQNVTITTLEGQYIIDGLIRENRLDWLKDTLSQQLSPIRPRYTFNTLARACLAGKSLPEEEPQSQPVPCPFLENGCCTIYPLRPFGCRSFLSKTTCGQGRPAVVDEAHIAGVTVVGQLLEHLSQRQAWGNMLDLLPALITVGPKPSSPHLLRAQPLPGFLLGPAEHEAVQPLIEGIFTARAGDKTIEAILNGV